MNISRALYVLIPLLLACSGASAQTWEQVSPVLSEYLTLPYIASSADGTMLLSGGSRAPHTPMFLSTNSGAAWTTTTAPGGIWMSFAISADKKRIAAADYSSQKIYTSSNGGATWAASAAPSAFCRSVAGSADGQKLVAVHFVSGTVYVSTNGGGVWTRATNAPLAAWEAVTSSADGSKLVAVNYYPGTICASKDGGLGWAQSTNAPTANWMDVASSAEGSKVIALTSTGGVFTSADFGASWAASTAPSATWTGCAVSADFSILILCSSSGLIYTSSDSGATWQSNSIPRRSWNSVAMSADGSRLFAIASGADGGIWRSLGTPTPRLKATASSGTLCLTWVLPSVKFVPQQSVDCASCSWKDLTNLPVLNLTNLHYEVTLPLSGGSFFRLRKE